MTKVVFSCLSIVAICFCAACSETVEPEPVKKEEPKVFAFNNTNAVLKAEEVKAAVEQAKTVKADFNLDGRQDIAIVNTDEEGKEVVSVYIQASFRSTAAGQAIENISYFKGGNIIPPTEATIRGIMLKPSAKYIDLIIVYSFPFKDNETVHYRNDGKSFSIIDHFQTELDQN